MYSNIEIEAKVLLTKEEYEKVYASLRMNDSMTHSQTNFYIDSKDRTLKNNGVALRIREKKGEYVLTMKTPLSEGLLEKNQALKDKEAMSMINLNRFPEGEIKEFLEVLDIDTSTLVVLAKLTTLRTEIDNPNEEEEISLDENTYGHKVDYELEVDKSAMALAEEKVKEILEPLKIKYTLNKCSKASRALAEAEAEGK
ncbi:MAG: CYTH domain-containing protein [Bacilli bacterium]|jgi:uncharacterized protein YjbK|nr:CYTH domain-containing protein [Bacilli bacterium]